MQKNIKHDMCDILMHATLTALNIYFFFISRNRLRLYVDKEILLPYVSQCRYDEMHVTKYDFLQFEYDIFT